MTLMKGFTLIKEFYKKYIVPLGIAIWEYEFPTWEKISFPFVIGFSITVVVGAITVGISGYYILYLLFFTGIAMITAPIALFLFSYMLYWLGSLDRITDEFDKILFRFFSFVMMGVAVIIILSGLFG